jgi:hypothetical protein
MSATADTTFDLFVEAIMSDEDRGYPMNVAFVSEDLADVDAILWRNLHRDHQATVVVTGDDTEILLVPCGRTGPLGWIDGLRGTVMVQIAWRHHKFASPYTVTTRVGRQPLAGMRRPPVCA